MIRKPSISRRRRRGTLYLHVLYTTLIVSAVAYGGFLAVRLNEHRDRLERNWNNAGVLANSAVEHALVAMSNDFWWREVYKDYKDGNFTPSSQMGDGQISWLLDDPIDGNIHDDPNDPVRIYGRGQVGSSTRVYSTLAWPYGFTLDVLRTAVHADGNLSASGDSVLDTRNGPLSAAGSINLDGAIVLGDTESNAIDAPENVTGSVLTPAPSKVMPASILFDVYKSASSEIRFNELLPLNTLTHTIVSPANNPTPSKPTNANGVYYIKVPEAMTLTIENTRIEGTLLVELDRDSSKLRINPGVLWKPFRPDYPALIVYTKHDIGTDVEIECSGQLDEAALGVNFNPADTPYYTDSDNDMSDVYVSSIRGLMHIIRETDLPPLSTTRITATNRISGCFVVDGNVEIGENSILAADPMLYAHPPLGYTTAAVPGNLLANGDMEAGLANWTAVGAGTQFKWDGNQHSGDYAIKIEKRSSASGGIRQDVTSKLVNGATFESEVWLKMNDDPEEVKVSLQIDSTGGGMQWFHATALVAKSNYTRVIVEHTPTWTGDLNFARWVVTTTTTGQDFLIDDALIRDPNEELPPNLIALPGTWEYEDAQQ